MRPEYPDSSKLPARTMVAYALQCRWRGRLKLDATVSIPGVILRKQRFSMNPDTSQIVSDNPERCKTSLTSTGCHVKYIQDHRLIIRHFLLQGNYVMQKSKAALA